MEKNDTVHIPFEPSEIIDQSPSMEDNQGNSSAENLCGDRSTYTPLKLKTKKSPAFRVGYGMETVVRDKMSLWTASKIELVELQKNNEMERHKKQLHYMQVEHEDYLKIKEQEWQLKKTLMIQAYKAELNFKKSLILKSMKE